MSSLSSALSGNEKADGVSGGGQSCDRKCSYGYASSRGKRSTMEDCYEARFAQVDGCTIGLFGVFDGHGGSQAAEYVRKNLFENLIKHPQIVSDTRVAIFETYQQTDSEFLEDESNQKHDVGSTASTAILVGDRLVVANVGDSRAVICRGNTAYALSEDHKPNRKDERQRIEEAGGVVIWAGTWRVGGILAVSRAFGDRSLKQFVVAEPELQVYPSSLSLLSLSLHFSFQTATHPLKPLFLTQFFPFFHV
ncbi:hypothetical protein KP509_03G029400 [Ceratopteris richardii]|uniref:protein-serine/threonine phosphatase n=1 Tax=Ceratopteris richardii TaxID=49495 RepID=A0A8T2V1D3_CERRI|nr:hypothetical protein KP509_03G029400 [Ceratopteris richardii]